MNWEVFVTCAITGAGDTTGKSQHVPVTPQQIADSAIAAAKAGAAVVHIHVRDPEHRRRCSRHRSCTRRSSSASATSGIDVVINLTAGMGGDLVLGGAEHPLPPNPDGTDMAGATERLDHVRAILPEICTLDCGTMNFASGGDYIMVNTPGTLKAMARQVQELGVRPELEVFDTGHLVFVKELIRDGLLDDPIMIQLCMGIAYGAPDDLTVAAWRMVNLLPEDSVFSAFSIGRMQLPYVAMAALAGGNVRVGLEDNLYLGPGQLATNADLVGQGGVDPRRHERRGHVAAGGARQAEAGQALSPDPRSRSRRAARRRGHRRRLGRPLPAQRRRRRPVRPRPAGGPQGRRGPRQRPAGVRQADDGAAARRGHADASSPRRRKRSPASTSSRRARPSGSS